MNPIKLIEKLINEHGSSSILRDRLLLLKDELSKIEKERADLQVKVGNCVKELAGLRKEVIKKSIPNEFVEYMGALFKRDVSGNYTPLAYCPECKRPLNSIDPDVVPYECSTPGCEYSVTIHEKLTSIVDKLNGDVT